VPFHGTVNVPCFASDLLQFGLIFVPSGLTLFQVGLIFVPSGLTLFHVGPIFVPSGLTLVPCWPNLCSKWADLRCTGLICVFTWPSFVGLSFDPNGLTFVPNGLTFVPNGLTFVPSGLTFVRSVRP
jgi:hypothetical protein